MFVYVHISARSSGSVFAHSVFAMALWNITTINTGN